MCIQNRLFSLLYKVVILAACGIGLLLSSGLLAGGLNASIFSYYNVLCATLCFVFYLFAAIWSAADLVKRGPAGDTLFANHIKGGIVIGMLSSMLVYQFLSVETLAQAPSVLGALLINYIVPILVLLDWALFDRKGRFRGSDPIVWLVVPYLYYTYVLVRAFFGVVYLDGSKYPYFFINADRLSWTQVLINVLILSCVYLLMGYVLYIADSALGVIVKKAKEDAEEDLDEEPLDPRRAAHEEREPNPLEDERRPRRRRAAMAEDEDRYSSAPAKKDTADSPRASSRTRATHGDAPHPAAKDEAGLFIPPDLQMDDPFDDLLQGKRPKGSLYDNSGHVGSSKSTGRTALRQESAPNVTAPTAGQPPVGHTGSFYPGAFPGSAPIAPAQPHRASAPSAFNEPGSASRAPTPTRQGSLFGTQPVDVPHTPVYKAEPQPSYPAEQPLFTYGAKPLANAPSATHPAGVEPAPPTAAYPQQPAAMPHQTGQFPAFGQGMQSVGAQPPRQTYTPAPEHAVQAAAPASASESAPLHTPAAPISRPSAPAAAAWQSPQPSQPSAAQASGQVYAASAAPPAQTPISTPSHNPTFNAPAAVQASAAPQQSAAPLSTVPNPVSTRRRRAAPPPAPSPQPGQTAPPNSPYPPNQQ